MKVPFPHLCNIYSDDIGDSFIGPFVEIQKGVKIGNNCRIQSHTFICEGVTIEDNVFIGHGVMFVNDLYPMQPKEKWGKILVKKGAVIGTNSTILPCTIGEYALVGAGSVVTKDVLAQVIVKGNPAKWL